MAKSTLQRRVTLVDTLFNEAFFLFSRTLIEYSKHLRHWDLRGTRGRSAFSYWDDVAWDEVDGVVCLQLGKPKARFLAGQNVSAVNICPDVPTAGLPQISNDQVAVGKMGARHLMDRGYPHYAHISDDSSQSNQQRDGFVEEIESAGKSCEVCSLENGSSGFVLDQILNWLDQFPKPIAMMGSMDYIARHIALAVDERGLRSPGDVGILGVNNNRWSSIFASVPLSSIQMDQAKMALAAVDTLDQLMNGQTVKPLQLIPPLRVVERQSTDAVVTQDPLVAKALQFIGDHAQQAITVEDVLAEVACSRSTLEKRMKAAIGSTVHHVITQTRVERVKHMLLTTDASTEHIAYHCGFQQQPRLYEAFKRMTGMTPGQFRQQHAYEYRQTNLD